MRLISAVLLMTLAALPARAEPLRVPVDDDFASFPIQRNITNRSSTVYWNTYAASGRLVICGLIQHHDPSLMMHDRTLLKRASVEVNGKPVIEGLQYFARVGMSQKPEASEAECRVTGVPVPPPDSKVVLMMPTITVRD
ncbi:hypothetical protein [Frigidibacter oleivorans]|uniref:hypothetical protein n=1 Tax=Frigidibacter oleivorans TaxID=2487129 RepID=UPI000F8F1447|nr:hypothetical protein [Frigidibacter oleivorans]